MPSGSRRSTFVLDVVDVQERPVMTVSHPSSWWMQRVQVRSGSGRLIGTLEECFTWIEKRMLIKDAAGRPRTEMECSLLSPWQHAFVHAHRGHKQRLGLVQKRWDGLARELFTDADTFTLTYDSPALDADTRALLLAAALLTDLVWFETNAAD